MARQDIRILSTKSLLSNQIQFLLNADFLVVEADFIQTETIDFDLKKVNDALIFTSQNAVKALLEHPEAEKIKSKTVFCVGIKTKALLEDNGFKVEAYAGYAEDLAQIIALVYSDNQYTFFSGNLRRDTLPDILTEAGIALNEIQVYETVLTPKKIDSKADGILFFSPSAVESYTQKNKIDKETAFCIGETTASAAADLGYKNIVIANQPTVENTIIQAINYFNPKH
ncbi:uroporphyrinogen-III synthase [Flavobacterium amniphilum]|uniref:uroporphyrinogen-III synthase n=1 Tax=Flavobacterium amniphilum TaxID=1834035 RepID=UPI00202AA88F|nr:uroporphyrinogen-III synthase [Flavobacterium amniphilum]MCL9804033.1 uroporphyrinogen-III synthase [Flavobacterium amniphilum]